MIGTGYWGDVISWTKVHLVDLKTLKPICNTWIGRKKSYQWCSSAMEMDYVECEKCRKKGTAILIERITKLKDNRR